MTVIVANDTPPAIRGLLKRWFVEPRPNVFVGTPNGRTREKVIDYVRRNASRLGMLILYDDTTSQGFSIESYGETKRRPIRLCGLQVLAETWTNEGDKHL